MKALLPLILLSVLAVSCGNKNSTGSTSKNHDSDPLVNPGQNSYLTYDQEQALGRKYVTAAHDVFSDNKSKIIRRYGRHNYDIIRNKLANLYIELIYQRLIDEAGKNVHSYYDGYKLQLYIGSDIPNLSWRRMLKDRDSRVNDKIYNDLISLRTNGNYRGSSTFYRQSSSKSNGGNGTFHYDFSIQK